VGRGIYPLGNCWGYIRGFSGDGLPDSVLFQKVRREYGWSGPLGRRGGHAQGKKKTAFILFNSNSDTEEKGMAVLSILAVENDQ